MRITYPNNTLNLNKSKNSPCSYRYCSASSACTLVDVKPDPSHTSTLHAPVTIVLLLLADSGGCKTRSLACDISPCTYHYFHHDSVDCTVVDVKPDPSHATSLHASITIVIMLLLTALWWSPLYCGEYRNQVPFMLHLSMLLSPLFCFFWLHSGGCETRSQPCDISPCSKL